MTNKIYALDLTNEEWITWFESELKQPKFRADQISQWIWQKKVFDADEMTNLSVQLRDLLKEHVDFSAPHLLKEQKSNIDSTRKFLWQLKDGATVESVLLRQGDRLTACISTQVGCPLQCTFCATGLSGYIRNLTAGEIAGQFLAMEQRLGHEINNVVYMGMGEPFLNTDEVIKSVRMLNSPKMRNLGIRHITLSTSGVIPGMAELAKSGLGVRLAISLHAANDELRSTLMPINQTFPLSELRRAMQEYQQETGDRLSIEYALFGGINDTVEHARELVRFLKGIHVFINLIPYNAVDGRYEKPEVEDILKFKTVLTTAGFEAEIRQEHGSDIDAACGQLRRKTLTGASEPLEPKPHTVTRTDSSHKNAQKTDIKPQRSTSPRGRKTSNFQTAEDKRVSKSPSGGYIEKRGAKHKKAELPEKDTYRSGKPKEARPSYRGQGNSQGAQNDFARDDRPSYNRDDKPSASRYSKDSKPSYNRDDKPSASRYSKDSKPSYNRDDKPSASRYSKDS
ncbi:MAG: 23S rRNA (adenine(2503)-C(2))-methyltransferase RlmN, partial [Synergistaceae bacterium]